LCFHVDLKGLDNGAPKRLKNYLDHFQTLHPQLCGEDKRGRGSKECKGEKRKVARKEYEQEREMEEVIGGG
jgi:hypothetical protein